MSKINILFETENYLVAEKSAGLLVYLPQGAKQEETLHDMVWEKLNFKAKDERSGIVHRLDKDTSGLILIAKNPNAQEKLKELFLKRTIEKKYVALVQGKLEPENGEIKIPLGRASKDRLRVVPKEMGKESVTSYKVLKYYPKNNFSLVDIGLKTGRTHQIRVHFGSIGHPVVGDPKYSRKRDDLNRQFLHAKSLRFIDPFNTKEVFVESELPEDLKNFLLKKGF